MATSTRTSSKRDKTSVSGAKPVIVDSNQLDALRQEIGEIRDELKGSNLSKERESELNHKLGVAEGRIAAMEEQEHQRTLKDRLTPSEETQQKAKGIVARGWDKTKDVGEHFVPTNKKEAGQLGLGFGLGWAFGQLGIVEMPFVGTGADVTVS